MLEPRDSGFGCSNRPQNGYKLQYPTHSVEEKERIQRSREQLWKALSTPRITSRSQLSHGHHGRPPTVDNPVGKIWSIYGSGSGPQSHFILRNEEAIYLTESHQLQLSWKNVPISVQQAYILYLDGKCSFPEYRVYSDLNRLGFRVTRTLFRKESGSNSLILKRRLPSFPSYAPLSKKTKLAPEKLPVNLSPVLLPHNTKAGPPMKVVSTQDMDNKSYRGFYEITDFNNPFLSLSKKTISKPYHVKDNIPYAYGEVQPLLRQEDKGSLCDIYKRLNIFDSSNEEINKGCERAVFNVFAPTTHFKKKSPGDPKYKISIHSSESHVPMDTRVLCSSNKNSELVQAIVTPNGSLSFFQFSKISLPTDLTLESNIL